MAKQLDERFLVLDRRIRRDLEVLDEIWGQLEEESPLKADIPEREAIFVGYKLHNLYSGAENIFRNIAEVFGNHLRRDAWHSDLLDRMRLDLSPLRPAVIDDKTYERLNEVRRFRHVFRAAYSVELSPERMLLVFRAAMELRETLPGQIEAFLEFLATVEGEESA